MNTVSIQPWISTKTLLFPSFWRLAANETAQKLPRRAEKAPCDLLEHTSVGVCVCMCAWFSAAYALPDSVCSICWNRGSPKMISPSLTTNSAVPFLRQTCLQPTSFQHSCQPLASSKHHVSGGARKSLSEQWKGEGTNLTCGQFLRGFVEKQRKESRNYKNRTGNSSRSNLTWMGALTR